MRVQRILGVDPGSRLTGFGCIDLVGNQLQHVAHGTLRLSNTGGKAVIPLEERLHSIYVGLSEVIREHRPHVLAVEKVFFAKNAVSALKLGQARGAVILTGMIHGLTIAEYSPSEVKQTVVGLGHADKEQVARMVQILVGRQEFDSSDASDGLALAICHAYRASIMGNQGAAFANALDSASGKRSKKRQSLADSLGITPESVAGQKRIRLSPK
jgi:crossover junction endodeoxyribonuclease RuvC